MPRADFRHLSDAELKDFFDIFDVDGGGSIDVDELPLLIRTLMFEEPPACEVARLLSKFDTSGDGVIQFDEFKELMRGYVSPMAITVPPIPFGDVGLTLRLRKDGKICIIAIDAALIPTLHDAAKRGLLRPAHPIAEIDGTRYSDVRDAAAYLTTRLRAHSVVLTLEAPEVHKDAQSWWQVNALAAAALSESGTLQASRTRARCPAANTMAESFHVGHTAALYF